MSARYSLAGRVYDVVSLEAVLYRKPRQRLMELLGPLPGRTVIDVGCGTGLNFAGLRQLVGHEGAVIGIDDSESMVRAARRRVARNGWRKITVIRGDANDLLVTLSDMDIDLTAVVGVVATFVVSLLPDAAGFWSSVDELAVQRPLRIGIADLGEPDDAPWLVRPLLRLLSNVGGGDTHRRPWNLLVRRCTAAVHEQRLGGHVHLAAGTTDSRGASRAAAQ